MNVIISGGNFANKGAEAMLRTVQAELSRRIPGIAFFLWQIPEAYCQTAFSSGFIPILLPYAMAGRGWWLDRIISKQVRWSLKELVRSRDPGQLLSVFSKKKLLAAAWRKYFDRSSAKFDALLDISGFAYGDAWGLAKFRRIHPVLAYCRHNNKPVIFFPQAWGSFENPQVRCEGNRLLGGPVTKFYSRDESSSRFLEKALGEPSGSIPSFPDIAFCFQGGSEEQGREVLRRMGCAMKRPIIGVAPNMRVFERLPGEGAVNLYLQAVVKLIAHCMDKYDVDVVLQANEIQSQGLMADDRYLCSLIMAAVNRPDRCFMTREPLSAEMTKSLIGCFDFLFGSRFHSFVFAFSQGVPGLAVSWSHKYKELFALFGMEEYVLDCHEIDAEALIMKFEKAWSEYRKLKVGILEKADRLRIDVNTLFDEVVMHIHGA